jgi:pSer/pThr/pTyr-binding forkhead associated (FHA) protein
MENDENKQPQLIGLSGSYKDNEYQLTQDEFIIGRAPVCDLIMKESTISAKHAKIIKMNDDYEIIDLDSTNGTYVNGIKVDKKKLRTADKIKLDVFEFTFINPQDAVRTVMATTDEPKAIKETVVRPQEEEPQKEEEDSKEKTQPIPVINSKTSRVLKKGGNFFPGMIVGVLVSLIIAYCGVILSALIHFGFSTSNLFNIIRGQITIFPMLHQPITWINTREWNIQVIIVVVVLPIALLVGGLIAQSIGRKNRLITASVVAFFYVLFSLVAQLIAMNLNFENWLELGMSSGWGFSPQELNLAALIVFFWGVVFILSYMGTLFGEKK